LLVRVGIMCRHTILLLTSSIGLLLFRCRGHLLLRLRLVELLLLR
jgi:hypothetical protein